MEKVNDVWKVNRTKNYYRYDVFMYKKYQCLSLEKVESYFNFFIFWFLIILGLVDSKGGLAHSYSRPIYIHRGRQVPGDGGPSRRFMDVTNQIRPAKRRWFIRVPNQYRAENGAQNPPQCSRP